MRITRVLLLGICLQVLAIPAFGDVFYGIQFSPSPVSALQFNQHVNVSFSYTVTRTGGVLVFARPISAGSLTLRYAASGGALCPAGSGSGTGYFTITSGEVTVDEVRFQVWTPDQSELLLEFFVPVFFHFSDHAMYNIQFTPSSPSMVMFNQQVSLTYDYKTVEAGGVRIVSYPLTQGYSTPHSMYNGSPLYPMGSGSGTAHIKVTSGDVTVDEVRLSMYNADYTVTLLSLSIPVSYVYRVAAANDAAFSPEWPQGLRFEEHVNVTFDYQSTEAGGVRIFVLPMTGNGETANWGVSGSPLYPAGSGSGSGWITIHEGEATADAIKFSITNADGSVELARYEVPVNYHFADDVVRAVTLSPPSPAYFSLGHLDAQDLTYTHNEPAGARIWAEPMTDGARTPGAWWQGSEIVPLGSGSVSRTLTVNSDPATVDHLCMDLRDLNGLVQLSEWYVATELHFSNQPSVAVVPPGPPAAHEGALLDFPNPLGEGGLICWRLAREGRVSLDLFDVAGRRLARLLDGREPAGLGGVPLRVGGIPSGTYFLRLRTDSPGGPGEVDSRKILILK